MTNQRIDGYLSRLAQRYWPTSTVIVVNEDEDGEKWTLHRDGMDDLGLGDNWKLASQGIRALLRAEMERRK